jgi:hypothetical protein
LTSRESKLVESERAPEIGSEESKSERKRASAASSDGSMVLRRFQTCAVLVH